MKPHKLRALQSDQAFAAFGIAAHHERHLALTDRANPLVADGRAVRVAA